MPRDRPLSGRSVAITGAARGAGLHAAAALVQAGANVVLGDVDAGLVKREAARLGATGLPLDVTDETSFACFITGAEREHGPLDVLINNAAITPSGAFLEQTPELIEVLFAINVLGTMRGVRLALSGMLERGAGQIVNIASVAGRPEATAASAHCATKQAVVGFTRALQREYEGSGVLFTLVASSVERPGRGERRSGGRGRARELAGVGQGIAEVIVRPRDELTLPRPGPVLVQDLRPV